MKDIIDSRGTCPPMRTLVEWFDGTLAALEADSVEQHLDGCGTCRRSLLDWSGRGATNYPSPCLPRRGQGGGRGADEATSPGPSLVSRGSESDGPASTRCPDNETLVAYATTAVLDSTTAATVEAHLQGCVRCVEALQQVMTLHRQMPVHEDTAATQVAPAAVAAEAPSRGLPERVGDRLAQLVGSWWAGLRVSFTPRLWPTAALAAALIVLAIGVSRFLLPGAQFQDMQVRDAVRVVTVEVTTDTAGHARPAVTEPVVVQLARGTRARWLETAGEWTRIELTDGRRVWVESEAVAEVHDE